MKDTRLISIDAQDLIDMSSNVMDRNNGSISSNAFRSTLRYRGDSGNNNKNNFECIDDDDESEIKREMIIITMPTDKIDQLRGESENRQISLNTNINQI